MLFYLYAGEKPDSGRMNLPEMLTVGHSDKKNILSSNRTEKEGFMEYSIQLNAVNNPQKNVRAFATMGIMLVCAYLLGTTQAETITEVQTVTETREVIPDGYIPLHDDIVDMNTIVDFSATEYGLQLYFEDGSGYFWER